MSNKEKAVKQLESINITATIQNGTVYVHIDDVQLELADFEIDFRAKLYNEQN